MKIDLLMSIQFQLVKVTEKCSRMIIYGHEIQFPQLRDSFYQLLHE